MSSRDIERSLKNREKFLQHQKAISSRDKQLRDLATYISFEDAVTNYPSRLLKDTESSKLNKLSDEFIDSAANQRKICNAHSKNIALGGSDLKFYGRAKSIWLPKGVF